MDRHFLNHSLPNWLTGAPSRCPVLLSKRSITNQLIQLQNDHCFLAFSYGGSQNPCLSGQMVAVPSCSCAADNLGLDFDLDLISGFDDTWTPGPPTVTVTTLASFKGVSTVGAM